MNACGNWKEQSIVAFDTETTGTGETAQIVDVAAVRYDLTDSGSVNERVIFESLIWPDPEPDWTAIDVQKAMDVNKLSPSLLNGCPTFKGVLPVLMSAMNAPILVAHNASFDQRMIKQERKRLPDKASHLVPRPWLVLDTMLLDVALNPAPAKRRLDVVAQRWGVEQESAHRARVDAQTCGRVLQNMLTRLPDDLEELKAMQAAAAQKWAQVCARFNRA